MGWRAASVGTFAQAAEFGDLVVLAVKGSVAEAAVDLCDGKLAGKTVIDATNPLKDVPPSNGVLAFFNDSSQVAVAQGQLLAASGSLDRAALKYLERSMGEQVVSLVAQAYQDPRVTDPAAKEPLVRSALAFVGANDQALQVFGQAVRDPAFRASPSATSWRT